MIRGACVLLAAGLLPSPAAAAPLDVLDDADGWYTWRVEAAEGAPAWCCFAWNGKSPGNRPGGGTCNLDRDGAYGTCEADATLDGTAQIYARLNAGEPVKLRVLSPGCAIEAAGGVTDLGDVEADESFAWLRGLVDSGARSSEDALAAIAVHRGRRPLDYLVDAANGGAEGEVRKNAIFWLGQVRIAEAASTIERLMFADESDDVRQHAAFVLSQSRAPNRVAALIRQGRQDADGDTRSQAWFWLAQTGAPESEQVIFQAIARDPDREVREEAVFALSQLPDERSVDALLSILENGEFQREVREQALFWLAQSDSDRAMAAIERLLAGASAERR